MTEGTTIITNNDGIHARSASLFVQIASTFKSTIQIKAKGKCVEGKSILMIMSMGLVKGTVITICAHGADEEKAVITLCNLVDSKFGEDGEDISNIDKAKKHQIPKEQMEKLAKEKGLKFRRAGN